MIIRSIRHGRRGRAAAATAVLSVVLSLATAPVVLAAPRVVVSPSNGMPGAAVKATASGFPIGDIEFLWDGTLSLGTRASDTNGRAVLSFAIPATAGSGQHSVVACSAGCAVSAQGKVTVVPTPTPVPTAPPTPTPTPTAPPPTPAPTPKGTSNPPAPTPRPTAQPTPRPPGTTPEPPGTTPEPPGTTPGPSAAPSAAVASPGEASPSPMASTTPDSLEPGSSALASGGQAPSLGSAGPSTPPPLAGGPVSDETGLAGRLVLPIGVIGILIVAGLLLAKARARPMRAASAARGGAGRAAVGIDPEPLSALSDPVSPFLEPIAPAPARASAVPAADPWANAKTITIHVEQVDTGEE